MRSYPRNAEEIAKRYIGTTGPLKVLGSGMGGVVFLAPDLRTAVKVHHQLEGYATEVEAYKRLAAAKLNKVRGLTVPRMRDYRDEALLIRMDVVKPPLLLDFAGVCCLTRPISLTMR